MFPQINQNESIYLISYEPIERFNVILRELETVTLALPMHLDCRQLWYLFIDLWIHASTEEQYLIEHPENTLIYSVRKTIIHSLFKLPAVHRTLLLTRKNDRFAYLFSFYLLIEADAIFTKLMEKDEELREIFIEISPYATKEISGYFDMSFQQLESYPKQLALAQSKAFKKLTCLFKSNDHIFNEQLQDTIKQAKNLYYLLYDDLI